MAKEEAKFGEERVLTVVLARDGRGRPSERRFGVCTAIVSFASYLHFDFMYFFPFQVAFKGKLKSASAHFLIGSYMHCIMLLA